MGGAKWNDLLIQLAKGRDLTAITSLHWLLGQRLRPAVSKFSRGGVGARRAQTSAAGRSMSRHLDQVRSFLEQLEAWDRREGAILAREFSVSDTPAIKFRS